MQLAWLHELGIDKPWLPGDTRAVPVVERNAEAAAVIKNEAPLQTAAAPTIPTIPTGRAATRGATSKPQQAPAPMSAASIAAMTALTAAAAAAAPDLEALAHAAAACQACGLCRQRDQVVMGQGVTQPAILVIGDGPGE